jgi:archaemetzincin
MERKIILYPIGEIEGGVMDSLKKDIEKTYDCKVEKHAVLKIPSSAFNPTRKQYNSSVILKSLHGILSLAQQEKALEITDIDLYAEGLNFVFGEAELGGQCAVISLTRLRQGFYSLPENKTNFLERAIKEAIHELGHVYGLEHCPDSDCVMHFSNSLLDTDRKNASFCPRCQKVIEELFQ